MERRVNLWILHGRSVVVLCHQPFVELMVISGVVAQQLLLLPFHPSEPAPIHFRCTHLFLAGTRSVVLHDHCLGLQYSKPPSNMTRTPAEKLEIAKRLIQATLDPVWLQENPSRFAVILKRTLSGG